MINEATIRQIASQTLPDSSFRIMLSEIDALREIVRRFKLIPIHHDNQLHDRLWDDANNLVPFDAKEVRRE